MSKTVSASPELRVIARWFERVPSESNVADAPSRGDPHEAAQLVNGQVLGDLCLPEDVLESFVSDEMYSAFSTLFRFVPLPEHDLIGGEAGRV